MAKRQDRLHTNEEALNYEERYGRLGIVAGIGRRIVVLEAEVDNLHSLQTSAINVNGGRDFTAPQGYLHRVTTQPPGIVTKGHIIEGSDNYSPRFIHAEHIELQEDQPYVVYAGRLVVIKQHIYAEDIVRGPEEALKPAFRLDPNYVHVDLVDTRQVHGEPFAKGYMLIGGA